MSDAARGRRTLGKTQALSKATRAASIPGRPGRGAGPTWWFWAFLALVFALKLAVVFQLKDHPLVQPDAGLDTTAYVDLARRVLGGDLGLGPNLYYVSPLYIYFLAAGLALTDSFAAIRVFQVLLGTAAVGLVWLAAREWFNDRAAWLAAAFAALTGLFTFYEALLLQAALDPFLSAAALFALAAGLRRDQPRWMLLAGLAFGIATLNRPNMLLAAAGLGAVLLTTRRVRLAALLAAGLAAGLSPAAIRNIVVSGQWSVVSSHGGLNFYIGNHAGATGFYQQVPGIAPSIDGQARDARAVAGKALGRTVTDGEASDYFVTLGLTWMREQPGAAAMLLIRKLGYVFNAQHIALPYSYPFYAHDARTLLRFYVVGPWLLIPLGLVGLAFAVPVSQRGAYLVWASFVLTYAAGVAAFFVAERYRLPLLVPLSVGAGAGLDWAVAAFRAGRVRTLLVPGLILATLLGLTNLSHGLKDGRWDEGLRMAQRLVIMGQFDQADEWTEKLEASADRPGTAHYGVGVQLLVGGQTARAVDHLTRAFAMDGGRPNAEYALGQALLNAGETATALGHLQRGFDAGADLPMAGFDLAVALQRTGDIAGALRVVRGLAVSDHADAEVWLRVGRLAMELKAPDVAEPFFRRGVELSPDAAGARQQLGLNLLVQERDAEAASELGHAVRLNPRDADSLAHLAYCEVRLGRFADAQAHVAAALALDPAHPVARQVAQALDRVR